MRLIINPATEISISEKNSKMGLIPSFSVSPILTCNKNIPCKKDCYARKLEKLRPSVRNAWAMNSSAILDEENHQTIIQVISEYIQRKGIKNFRWNVAGDFGIDGYFEIASRVAEANQNCKFLAFTKFFNLKSAHDNFKVIYSCWGDYLPEDTENPRAYFDDGSITNIPQSAQECDGNCEACAKCWDLGRGQSVKFKKH